MLTNYRTMNNYLYLTVGTLVSALGINTIAAKNLAFGGVSGLSIVIEFLTDLPLSTLNILINIPLFIIGTRFIGKIFLIRSIYSTVMLSLFLNMTAIIRSCNIDLIVASIFGGIILGIGVAIVAKAGGSTGGTDMLALVLHNSTSKQLGTYIWLIDGSIILLGVAIFGINKALYAIIVVFFIGQSVNKTMKYFNNSNIFFQIYH